LEKFLGANMKCEMPDCNNKSTKTVTKEGVLYGVYVDNSCMNVCEEHTIHEVNTQLNEIFVDNCISSQECNPFMQAEFIKKPSK
jgi:hypothetical protein